MKKLIITFFVAVMAVVSVSAMAEEPEKKDVIEIKAGQTLPEPTASKAVVIDFNASWCMPCRMFKPAFDRAAKDYSSKAVFVSVNIDENEELAKAYSVRSIPYVVVLRKGEEPVTHLGAMSYDDFRAFLNDALN